MQFKLVPGLSFFRLEWVYGFFGLESEIFEDFAWEAFPVPALATLPPTDLISEIHQIDGGGGAPIVVVARSARLGINVTSLSLSLATIAKPPLDHRVMGSEISSRSPRTAT